MRASRAALLLLVLVAAALPARPALALGVDEAKARGLVGEQADGYLGVVDGSSSEARALADRINAKRREEYSAIASKRGTAVDAVAKLAGQKLVQRAPAGQYVRGSDGRWVKK
jgi:uncharacterized protein YdbL (DUF1318 family)